MIYLFLILSLLKLSAGLVKYGLNDYAIGNNGEKLKLEIEKYEQEYQNMHHNLQSSFNVHKMKYILLPTVHPSTKSGEYIQFQLFDGLIVYGIVSETTSRNEGAITWMGDIFIPDNNLPYSSTIKTDNFNKSENSVQGNFGLCCIRKACTAKIRLFDGNEYTIHPAPHAKLAPDGNGLYMLSQSKVEIRDTRGVHINEHLKVATKKSSATLRSTASTADVDLIVDILATYTPQALALIGSISALESKVYLANDLANAILARSEVSLRFRIVAIKQTEPTFIEPSSGDIIGALLGQVTDGNDGNMDIVHTYRADVGADAVVLLSDAQQACSGVAWVNGGYISDYMYSSHGIQCFDEYFLTHELGHNFGCLHDRIDGYSYAQANPDFFGFGNCWLDASKTDCTCYKSVMTYYCSIPGCLNSNNRTDCTDKMYLANKKVMDAGNPTGLDDASCGLYISNNGLTISNIFPSKLNSGIISSLSLTSVVSSTCATVNITGWRLSASLSDNIATVMFGSHQTNIISQSLDSVVVQTPSFDLDQYAIVDIIITTATWRTTVLMNGFQFDPQDIPINISINTFDDEMLNDWESDGSMPWSFSSDGYIYKHGTPYLDTDYASMTITSGSSTDHHGCEVTYSEVSFKYYAYSDYSFCYDKFTVSSHHTSSETAFTQQWTWSGSFIDDWIQVTLPLPSDTTSINIYINTYSGVAGCRWVSDVKIDNLIVTGTYFNCDSSAYCTTYKSTTSNTTSFKPTKQPLSFRPTLKPSSEPSSLLSAIPSLKPTRIPSSNNPTTTPSNEPISIPTAIPSSKPTKLPSAIPSQIPTNVPSYAPTTYPSLSIPAVTTPPTDPISLKYPTAKPTSLPSSAKPKSSPTAKPIKSVKPTSRPTVKPSLKI
eukprot:gene10055-13515_t